MNFKFPYRNCNPRELIRRAGYGENQDPNPTETNYVRKLGQGFYPRFHIYLKELEKYFEVSLHLDQKQPSYGNEHAHSGEYDGDTVEDEARRITQVIKEIYASE